MEGVCSCRQGLLTRDDVVGLPIVGVTSISTSPSETHRLTSATMSLPSGPGKGLADVLEFAARDQVASTHPF